MKVDLSTQVGRPFNPDLIDRDVHRLWSTGRFSDIRVEKSEDSDGTNVVFNVVQAPRPKPAAPPQPAADNHIHIKKVNFIGEPGIDPEQLRRALRTLRARRFWPVAPSYSLEAVDADLARLRSLYLMKGYFEATVRVDHTDIQPKNAAITFFVRSGPHSETRQPIPQLCSSLLAQRRNAERHGVLDFSATVHVVPDSNAVNLAPEVHLGPSYHIGRIEFTGNHHYSDAFVRRNLLLDEGQLLDEVKLRKSAGRINQAGLFEPITAANIAIHTKEGSDIADISIHLKERKRGAWNLSGPVGPASFAGPLDGTISSHLPPWGRGLLELSSYTVSLTMIAFAHPILPAVSIVPKGTLIPVLALSRPFTPGEGWKSGFSIVPQLGWRASAIIYSTTQIQQRLLPLLSGDREPDLPVTVDGTNGEATLFCEAPRPHLMPLRIAASFTLRLAGTFTGL